MKKIVFATGNPTKAKRFSKGLHDKNIDVISLKDLNIEFIDTSHELKDKINSIDLEKSGEKAKI